MRCYLRLIRLLCMTTNIASGVPAAPAASIELRDAQWRFPSGSPLYPDPINLTLRRERTGLVGRNGSGKSLLCALIAGHLTPSSGVVVRHVPVHAVVQEPIGNTASDLAGLSQYFAAFSRIESGLAEQDDWDLAEGRWDLPAKWAIAMRDAGLPAIGPDDAASTLSGGQRQRVALAGAFLMSGTFLVLDEPSNHLDAGARDWLLNRMAQWPSGAIIASHDRALLARMDRIVEIESNGLQSYGGNYDFYSQQRDLANAAAQADLAHARAERARARRTWREQHDAQQRRAAKGRRFGKDANLPGVYLSRLKGGAEAYDGRELQRRQKAAEAANSAVSSAAARVEDSPGVALLLQPSHVPEGRLVLRAENLRLPFFPNAAPFDLSLQGPRRVALTGPNGGGKSTLLRLIARHGTKQHAGQRNPGERGLQVNVAAALLDQHALSDVSAASTVLDLLAGSPLSEPERRTRLALLGLDGAAVVRPVVELSGGERMKAALARALWGQEPAALLLLDEPGNHLDLPSQRALESALADFNGALIVASHDPYALAAFQVDVQWVVRAGHVSTSGHGLQASDRSDAAGF